MNPPVVQDLAQIVAELDPAYAGVRNQYNSQLSAVPGKYTAQKEALGVKKENDFRDINRGANARGMAFSGMPIEEQTRYLGEQYLPGLAAYDQQANQEMSQLQLLIAELEKDKTLRATDTRTGQQSAYATWQQAEQDRRYQAEQARIEREWKTSEAAKERAAAASLAAAGRGSGQSDKAADRLTSTADTISGGLVAQAGSDGRVSPKTWGKAKRQWIGMGYSGAAFDDRFGQFVNGKHAKDYFLGG